jgi:two-component system, LytTR family, sensor kinase
MDIRLSSRWRRMISPSVDPALTVHQSSARLTMLGPGEAPMDLVMGVLLGVALSASLLAAVRLLSTPRVLSPGEESMRALLHAATATLPQLRQGLGEETAKRSVRHVRTLTGSDGVAIAGPGGVLAVDGDTGAIAEGDAPDWLEGRHADRVRVERLESGSAVVAPLVAGHARQGSLLCIYPAGTAARPEDIRMVEEAASLLSAQLELSAVEEQEERLARAELAALRAQISPHFIYNALAAVASLIHTRPDEARELLTEFAEFTRYAFRGRRAHVTLADELHYVEKYLRLEQARFGDRLQVRVEVAPEVLGAVVPVLSLQPLVENAVRHGIEAGRPGVRVEIVGRDLGVDVELRVCDDGAGMDPGRAAEALDGRAGGIGLSNVHGRLQSTFGPEYGLRVESEPGRGTTVVLFVPKFRAGVRAA